MRNDVPALTAAFLALMIAGTAASAQNAAPNGQKTTSVTLKSSSLVSCAPYSVNSKGEVQAPSPFAQSTPNKAWCDEEGAIIASLKPKPVLKRDQKQSAAVKAALDNRIKKVKECFEKHY